MPVSVCPLGQHYTLGLNQPGFSLENVDFYLCYIWTKIQEVKGHYTNCSFHIPI